jgi:A/G-specific adenine glycosylase
MPVPLPQDAVYNTFTEPLLTWYDVNGRKDLPWQAPYDAYRVWVSEIMLQQTQVKTVIDYFLRFIARFPSVQSLATASEDEVLALWSGLGYYSRARNLYKAAQMIVQQFHSQFPSDSKILETLPGVGASTAAAISSLAFEKACAILDGNVKRVLSRYFLIEGPTDKAAVKYHLWEYANQCLSHSRPRAYSQAIMDLGATCCTPKNPRCIECPLKTTCRAHLSHQVDQYPQKAAKKIRPIKHEQFLLLYTNQGELYLEKRPSKGIWGGLWCLPAIEQSQCVRAYLQDAHQFNPEIMQPFIQLKHQFTHFQLHIDAWLIPVKENIAKTHPHPEYGAWFHKQNLQHIGLAKPIATLVELWILKDENLAMHESF